MTCSACAKPIPHLAKACTHCGFLVEPIDRAELDRLTGEFSIVTVEELDTAPSERGNGERGQSRRAPRFPLQVDVDYGSEHNFYTGYLDNISSGGLFIATFQESRIGEQLQVKFTVPGVETTFSALCEVRWMRRPHPDSPEVPPGIGCRFVKLDTEARVAIEAFVRHRDTLFFDE